MKKGRRRKRLKKPAVPRDIVGACQSRLALKKPTQDWGGISEDTLAIAAARGEEIERFPARPGESEKPPKRLSGLDWLWFKSRINSIQMGAGLKYGDDYRVATDVSVRSAANWQIMGGDGSTAMDARMDAQDRLAVVRAHGLAGHPELIDLCDKVAGEGTRIRQLAKGNEGLAQRKEAQFIIALDHLAKHYGMISG